MTIRAITKRKRTPRQIVCPDCRCAMESVAVMNANRFGEPMPGIEVRHVECGTCGSTGRVNRKPSGCQCCNGPKADRCANCANARRGGSEVHVCLIATEDEISYETELAFMEKPAHGAPSAAAGARAAGMDLGPGERSGQRGGR